MAQLAALMGGMSMLAKARGAIDASRTAEWSGEQEQIAKEYEAAELDRAAGQSIAASQRSAAEQRRIARYASSRTLAVAAASGGADDPGVINIMADLDAEGAYRAAVAMYQGEEQARSYRTSANLRRHEGRLAKEAGQQRSRALRTQAVGSLMEGGASMFTKFGTG